MNEHLATENAALIAELANLQRKQRNEALQEGRRQQSSDLVAGVPKTQLESLLSTSDQQDTADHAVPSSSSAARSAAPSSPASAAALTSSSSQLAAAGSSAAEAAVPASSSAGGGLFTSPEADATLGRKEEEEHADSAAARSSLTESQQSTHSDLQQRAQLLETQVELTHLKAECEMLRSATAEAAAQAETKQGVVITLQRQLADAISQHQKEVRELKKAAKQVERQADELSQQLPKKADESTTQVGCL